MSSGVLKVHFLQKNRVDRILPAEVSGWKMCSDVCESLTANVLFGQVVRLSHQNKVAFVARLASGAFEFDCIDGEVEEIDLPDRLRECLGLVY